MKQFFTIKYIPVHVGIWGVIWGNFMYQISKIELNKNNINNNLHNNESLRNHKINNLIDEMDIFIL